MSFKNRAVPPWAQSCRRPGACMGPGWEDRPCFPPSRGQQIRQGPYELMSRCFWAVKRAENLLAVLQVPDWFAVQRLKADCSKHRWALWPILDKHECTFSGWSPAFHRMHLAHKRQEAFPSYSLSALSHGLHHPAFSPLDFSGTTDTWSRLFPKL